MSRVGRGRIIGSSSNAKSVLKFENWVDTTQKPAITYNGKWTGWYWETYDGSPYWECMIMSSGALTPGAGKTYTLDAFSIGGGGGYSALSESPYACSGGGSGYTAMASNLVLNQIQAVSIGAGSSGAGASGGATTFMTLTASGGTAGNGTNGGNGACGGGAGGYRVSTSSETQSAILGGKGGVNGANGADSYWHDGGKYGTGGTGQGLIMAKFYSADHNNMYGENTHATDAWGQPGSGGGGIMPMSIYMANDISSSLSVSYGSGGQRIGAYSNILYYNGTQGCLWIRIKI